MEPRTSGKINSSQHIYTKQIFETLIPWISIATMTSRTLLKTTVSKIPHSSSE